MKPPGAGNKRRREPTLKEKKYGPTSTPARKMMLVQGNTGIPRGRQKVVAGKARRFRKAFSKRSATGKEVRD